MLPNHILKAYDLKGNLINKQVNNCTLENHKLDKQKEETLLRSLSNLKLYLSPNVINYLSASIQLEIPILQDTEINTFFYENSWYQEILNYNLINRTIQLLKTLNTDQQQLFLYYHDYLLNVSLQHSTILKLDLKNKDITKVLTTTKPISEEQLKLQEDIIDGPLEYPHATTFTGLGRYGSPASARSRIRRNNATKELDRLLEMKNRPENIDIITSEINELLKDEYKENKLIKVKTIEK